MKDLSSWGLIIGVTIGVVIGVLLAVGALFCIRFRKKHAQIRLSSSRRASTIPMRVNGVDSSSVLSDSTMDQESPKHPETEADGSSFWIEGTKRKNLVSVSGIPKYFYKYGQERNFSFFNALTQLMCKYAYLDFPCFTSIYIHIRYDT